MNITSYLGQKVNVVVDRPLGSKHPKHGFTYEVNYGYVPNTNAPDGEEIDAYVLGLDKPINQTSGICIAIIHRIDDEDDKLVVTPNGEDFSDEEIEKFVNNNPVMEWAAAFSPAYTYQLSFFKHIEGSLTGSTRGLPMELLIPCLEKSGIKI